MPGKKSKAKAAVQAPGDPHPPPKPAPPARTSHMPTKEVVDEYVKVVGVENVAGTGIQVLDCALHGKQYPRSWWRPNLVRCLTKWGVVPPHSPPCHTTT